MHARFLFQNIMVNVLFNCFSYVRPNDRFSKRIYSLLCDRRSCYDCTKKTIETKLTHIGQTKKDCHWKIRR